MGSKIEWTETTWNPVVGCSRISEGCRNCYAERMAVRLENMGSEAYAGLTNGNLSKPRWTGKVRIVPGALSKPLRWRKPRRVFVNSMSDLFHEGLGNEDIAGLFGIMSLAAEHTLQVLTKRAERLPEFMGWLAREGAGAKERWVATVERAERACGEIPGTRRAALETKPEAAKLAESSGALLFRHGHKTPTSFYLQRWPLPNVHLGVSAEDQATADERIPHLLATPAAVRWVSAEPLLGPIGLDTVGRWWLSCADGHIPAERERFGCNPTLDWVVVGGESGPGARPCKLEWIRDIVRQCREAGVPVFVKQLGSHLARELGLKHSKGGDISEWPEGLQVRQWPEVHHG